MIIPERIVELSQSNQATQWAANADENNKPDLCRTMTTTVSEDRTSMTVYLPERFVGSIFDNAKEDSRMAIMLGDIATFESYQLKGRVKEAKLCSDEELEIARNGIRGFADRSGEFFNIPGDPIFISMFSTPIFAITVEVEEIFEQTPKVGTGNKLETASN